MAERLSFDKFHNIIDGKPRSADKFHQGVDPSTGEKLWDVPIATQQDVDDAVVAAEKAFKTWSKTPVEERKKMITKFDELYRSYEKEFTDLMCKETGKPRMFANGEVKGGSSQLQWHANLDIPTDTFEDKQKKVFTTYKPVGVCVGLLPWNFPIFLSVGKIAPALLTGCTMIVKPSPYTPFTSLKIVELAQQIFPPGVLQAVGGDDSLGPMFTAHPGVQKITFTGSIATGKKIYAACAKTLKRITLELGGNDPCIVCPDIDMDKQLSEVMMGAFFNSGQVCVASKRIYVHKDIYDTFLQKMIEFTKGMKVGSSDEPKVMVGPMQNSMQYDKVLDFFKDSREKGYKFAVGEAEPKKGKGFFINPTIIDNPPNDSMIITEEVFSPYIKSDYSLRYRTDFLLLAFRTHRPRPTLVRRRRSHRPSQQHEYRSIIYSFRQGPGTLPQNRKSARSWKCLRQQLL